MAESDYRYAPGGPVAVSLSPLTLLPTEAHATVALAKACRNEPNPPRFRSMRAFVEDVVALLIPEVAPASSIAVAIATYATVRELARERSLPGASETRTEATAVSLAATLDRAIGSLRRSGASPFAAKRSLGAWSSAVMERVDARLRDAGWLDARGIGARAARAIASAPASVLEELGVKGGVVLDGVFPWEGDDLLWIEALHRRLRAHFGTGVVIRLPRFVSEDGSVGPLAGAADPLADVLERRWGEAQDAIEIEWTNLPRGRVIGVRGARTLDAEARSVAAAIRDAVSSGLSPEKIAVVVPKTSDGVVEALAAALIEARIPFAEPRGRSVSACPDGRAALALLALAEGPFTRDGLLEVLRAPGLHAGVWVEANDEGEAASRVVRLAARMRDVPVDVDGSGRLFVDGLSDLVKDSPDDAWMARALDRMVKSVRWIAEGGTLREGLGRFVRLLDQAKLGQPSAIDLATALGDEKRGFGALSLSALGENASAVRRLREVIVELGSAALALGLGGSPVSAAELRALITGFAERTSARAGGTASRAGAVRIGRPEDLGGLPFDRVIVMGLTDAAYGDEGEEEDLLATDDEPREGRIRARAPRRSLALATALSSAPEVIFAFATGTDDEHAKPHALVVDALAHGVPLTAEPASRIAVRASVLGPRSAELLRLAGGRPPTADLAERVRVERVRHAFFMDPRTAACDFTGGIRTDGLRDVLPSLVGGATEAQSIAVTAIERAYGCAFAGFARRVLRISKKEDMLEAGDARERGTLVHRALSAAFEAARDAARGVIKSPHEKGANGASPGANGGVVFNRGSELDRGRQPAPSSRRSSAQVSASAGLVAEGVDAASSRRTGLTGPPPAWGAEAIDAPPKDPLAVANDEVLLLRSRLRHSPAANQQSVANDSARGAPAFDAPASAKPPASREAIFAAARAAAEGVLGLDRIVSPLRRYAILSAVRDALVVLSRSFGEDDPLRFHLGEQLFGRGAPHPWGPLALSPGDEEENALTVFVDGQIDRIDLSEDGRKLRVIDYKTGRLPEGDNKRIALQLPLYAAVAARALGAADIEAMYVRVTSRGLIDESPKRPADRVVTAEELVSRSREARNAVHALWEGRVSPRPMFLSLCARCDARDLCRRPAVMPIEEVEAST